MAKKNISKVAVQEMATSYKFETEIENEIEDIIEDAEGRYGFIDYHSASRFGSEMSYVQERISAKAPTDELRISLQLYIVRRLGEIAIDDSNGVILELMYTILDDFQCIYENEESREMLFKACMDFVTTYNGQVDYCVEEIEEFMLQFEGEAFAKRIEMYLETKIKALAKETDDWNFKFGAKKYITRLLQAKAAQRMDEEQLLAFAKPFWKSSDIRQFFVERYIKEERFKEAISLLEEGLLLDKQWAGTVSNHKKQLKDLYCKTGQKSKHIKMLRTLIEHSWDAEIELFDELKSQYSAKEWTTVREEIFQMKGKSEFTLAQLLQHESLTERLAELILNTNEPSVCMLDEFVPDLPEKYVPQILSAYDKAFNQQAAKANKRRDYEVLIYDTIKSVHDIKGGKELTDRLTQQWLEQYKRRPAFCEVIRNFRKNMKIKELWN